MSNHRVEGMLKTGIHPDEKFNASICPQCENVHFAAASAVSRVCDTKRGRELVLPPIPGAVTIVEIALNPEIAEAFGRRILALCEELKARHAEAKRIATEAVQP